MLSRDEPRGTRGEDSGADRLGSEGRMHFNTRLLHGKAVKKYGDGATLPAVAQVNAFAYDSAEELDRVFHHRAMGFAYSRVANPTVAAFEQRISEMERGNGAVALNSGMTAISLSLLNFLCAGDEVIASCGLYGGSLDLFDDLAKLGITTRFAREMTPEAVEPLVTERTRVIFGEVIGNPSLRVMDISAMAAFAHERGIPLIVDSTTATPFLVNPLELGADVVVHSTTKYINGSGNAMGGVVIDASRFPWDFQKTPALEKFRAYGKAAYLIRLRTDVSENMGGIMSPVSAFLNVVGLETLGLRMREICQNAEKLSKALDEAFPDLDVNYPLLERSPYAGIAREQLGGMGGGILTFRAGSREKAFSIINDLRYAVRATSIGDTRTLVIHPESTLYIHSDAGEKEAAGVYEDTVRVSVGIEDADDLIEDFAEAIRKNRG